jgi:hypothetical protein
MMIAPFIEPNGDDLLQFPQPKPIDLVRIIPSDNRYERIG